MENVLTFIDLKYILVHREIIKAHTARCLIQLVIIFESNWRDLFIDYLIYFLLNLLWLQLDLISLLGSLDSNLNMLIKNHSKNSQSCNLINIVEKLRIV